MERPKNTNRNKIKDKDISLEVFCVSPTPQIKTDHDTSVFEIDIQSDFEFKNRGARTKSADVDSKESAMEYKKKSKGSKETRNPFIQSYYPDFLGTSSDFNQLQKKKLEATAEIEVIREETHRAGGKADKENQWPSHHTDSKFEEFLKNYMLEHFFSNKGKDLKGFFQKCESMFDSKGLHFHHHEHHHHHHYYLDKSVVSHASEKSDSSSTGTRVSFGKVKRKKYERNEKTEEEQKEIMNLCRPDLKSNATFMRLNLEPEKKPAPAKSVKCSPSLRFKNSVSMESVLHKKSDFIRSHVYSDTDLTKRDSDDAGDPDTLEGAAGASQDCKSNYSLIMNSLKNFNQFKLPVILTDQKTLPRVSYITCQCASSDLLQKMSNVVLINSEKTQNRSTELEKTSESDDSGNQAGINQRTSNSNGSNKLRFEIWTAKLKAELKEIKKELRKIEERHSKKAKPPFLQFSRDKSPSPNPKRTRRISVYSSKTYVISPEDVCLNKKRKCKQLEKSSDFVLDQERLFLSGGQVNEVLLWPGEGSTKKDKEYNEDSFSKYEQAYSNGMCNLSN